MNSVNSTFTFSLERVLQRFTYLIAVLMTVELLQQIEIVNCERFVGPQRTQHFAIDNDGAGRFGQLQNALTVDTQKHQVLSGDGQETFYHIANITLVYAVQFQEFESFLQRLIAVHRIERGPDQSVQVVANAVLHVRNETDADAVGGFL
jgi:hypothetical protein